MVYKTKISLLPALLFIASMTVYAKAEPFVLVDSLCGKAEVQRAGKLLWQPCAVKMKLYNNDIIHSLPEGMVRLSWPDGTVSYIHQNTQMLMTMVQNEDRKNKLLNHATIFFGAVFFLVKKIAPRGIIDDSRLKIYTPTAVLSIRGTAFLTSVDEKTGATSVKVITGTVQVRNIIKNTALFLGSPFQSTVSMNSDPSAPAVVLKHDIDSIKGWVPVAVIAEAMEKQIQQVKKDANARNGKLENKSVAISFANFSMYNGHWPIAAAMANSLSERLKKTNPNLLFSVFDSTAGGNLLDPAGTGNARFVIIGTIETFDISQHAEISTRADEYREYSVANVSLRIRLIDELVGQQVAEETFSGEMISNDAATNSWQNIGALQFDLKDKAFSASIMGKALEQALDLAAEKVARYIE
jgi:hypothetical protein